MNPLQMEYCVIQVLLVTLSMAAGGWDIEAMRETEFCPAKSQFAVLVK
jgi:hypothetical protein